ncbi:MAG: phage holin [Clostridiales bacterium]|jgi:phi LC3 family holin|nr:phage holin [Clostridiales bacterium]MED9957986.1 phage holin [Christensenellales bacterium]DAM46484.1 MAG TPA: holin [Caudoviricetes sp.]
MNINWKIRFQNKTFLTGLISLVVVFIYDLLQLLEIAPAVTQSAVMQVAEGILTILGMLGVIADPTTAGLSDSKQALTYTSPKQD